MNHVKDNEIFLNTSKSITSPYLAFHDQATETGRLYFNGEKMVFSGNVEESAKIFFDKVCSLLNTKISEQSNRIKELESQLAASEPERGDK